MGAPFDVSFANPLARRLFSNLACCNLELNSITQSTSRVGRISDAAESVA